MTQMSSVVTHYKTPLCTLEKTTNSLLCGMVQNVNLTSPVKLDELDDFITQAKGLACKQIQK